MGPAPRSDIGFQLSYAGIGRRMPRGDAAIGPGNWTFVRAMAGSTAPLGKTRSAWTRFIFRPTNTPLATRWGGGDLRNFAGAIDATGTIEGHWTFIVSKAPTRREQEWPSLNSEPNCWSTSVMS